MKHTQAKTSPGDRSVPDTALAEPLLALSGATELTRLWRGTVKLLQIAAPHHTAFMWCDYFDFTKSSKSTLVFEHPRHARPTDYWEGRRKHHLTAGYLQTHAGLKLYRMTDVVALEETHRSTFYQLYMQPEGWEFAATLAFWHDNQLRACIALYRTAGQNNFTNAEMDRLASLHAFIETPLFRLLDQQPSQAMHQVLEEFLQGLPVGLLLLNWDLQPVFINEEGYDLALAWNRGVEVARTLNSRKSFELPAAFVETCEAIKHRWLETLVPGQPQPGRIVQRVTHGGNAAWHALIMTQTVHSVSPSRPSFLVRFHRLPASGVVANPSERQIELFEQLSPSEREIARLVVAGHSNAEIAVRLHKQVSTVKTQLTSIFTKLNVKNRNRLTALLQG